MAKMKRTVTVEGDYVVMVQNDDAPIADGCKNEWEAAVVALLVSLGPYAGKVVTIAFRPEDSESPDDLVGDPRLWYNGEEYQAGDDLNEPKDMLLWLARYGYGQEFKDTGRPAPKSLWELDNATMNNNVKKWLIRVASEHEVHHLLPDECVQSENDDRSGDRYHVALLRDLVRNPDSHHLDDSERRGILVTLERLMQQAGLE